MAAAVLLMIYWRLIVKMKVWQIPEQQFLHHNMMDHISSIYVSINNMMDHISITNTSSPLQHPALSTSVCAGVVFLLGGAGTVPGGSTVVSFARHRLLPNE